MTSNDSGPPLLGFLVRQKAQNPTVSWKHFAVPHTDCKDAINDAYLIAGSQYWRTGIAILLKGAFCWNEKNLFPDRNR